MENALSSIAIFGLSTFKFLSGIVVAMVNKSGLIPSYVLTISGGIVGVIVFTYFGNWIAKTWAKLFPTRTKRHFTSWNRFLVRLRRTFGLTGIAFLTPFISIPIGIFLSLSVTKNKFKIISSMAISFTFWASVFFLPYYLFDFDIKAYFVGLF